MLFRQTTTFGPQLCYKMPTNVKSVILRILTLGRSQSDSPEAIFEGDRDVESKYVPQRAK